jgi:hypothetical protein
MRSLRCMKRCFAALIPFLNQYEPRARRPRRCAQHYSHGHSSRLRIDGDQPIRRCRRALSVRPIHARRRLEFHAHRRHDAANRNVRAAREDSRARFQRHARLRHDGDLFIKRRSTRQRARLGDDELRRRPAVAIALFAVAWLALRTPRPSTIVL